MNQMLIIAGVEVPIFPDLITFLGGPTEIDDDGSGDPHNDPDFQARTSYRNPDPVTGVPRWLNADIHRYIVLPPQVIRSVPGKVLGCRALVLNTLTMQWCEAVVGDVGPSAKISEISICCAQAVGIPSSPTTGGESRPIIRQIIFPGRVALPQNGLDFALQSLALAA